jgi:23S rRNA 5-hydroxycytidine C2501 synthase
VQDMGILELDIPPIQLHASTQTDIRTLEKAKFMGEVGFSQIVLAREVTLKQIAAMRAEVNGDVALEYFIHGALCVAFSGNCYISHAHTGRSANRGECAQECRLPYTLQDKDGHVVAFDKHLLSMKDNDQSANLRMLIDAGIRSFKIEGRYKDVRYVKNITAHYRKLFDEIFNERPELARASHGRCSYTFTPDAEKTFNRSSTDYFANGRKDDIGAFDAPTHVGGELGRVVRVTADTFEIETTDATDTLANGDGLTYMNKREVRGMQANTAEKTGNVWRVSPNQVMRDLTGLTVGTVVHRNRDHAWEQVLAKPSADRRVALTMAFAETHDGFQLGVRDESGVSAVAQIIHAKDPATQPERAEASLRENLGKLGQTIFAVESITMTWSQPYFVPASVANQLRREAIDLLETNRSKALVRPLRAEATQPLAAYPETSLTYLANVYNQAARDFYSKHGVTLIAAAYEAHEEAGEVPLMVTKHCLRWSFNLCPKQAKGVTGVQGQVRAEPMTLLSNGETLNLKFDCKPCEMHVMGKARKHILQSPPPSIVPLSTIPNGGATIKFYAKRPETV